jgi:hypothetical protein
VVSPHLPPVETVHRGCLNCPPKPRKLNLNAYVHPGFGLVRVTRDDRTVLYDVHGEVPRPGRRAENLARKNPHCDWRLTIDGPLSGAVYQRHGPAEWVMVESLRGFA